MKYSLALLAAAAAVNASPFQRRAGVTSAMSPTASAPPSCTPSYSGSFGIVNINATAIAGSATGTVSGAVSQTTDGQPKATSGTVSGAVSQISDAQPQGGMTMAFVSMISDGQVQGGMHTAVMVPVTQISDGQVQGATVTMMPVSQISDGQVQATSTVASAISQISDGQPQATTVGPTAISQISDGQPQATTVGSSAISQISDGQAQASTAKGASQISDGQVQASTVKGVSQTVDGQAQASATGSASSSQATSIAFCKANDTLALTLNNGILKDAEGRTGYIASNYQLQFDNPPQAGAIYTAGFTVCGNGSLALGGSNVFYQCLSGSFYNLYDRNWAAQCNPVIIETGALVNC